MNLIKNIFILVILGLLSCSAKDTAEADVGDDIVADTSSVSSCFGPSIDGTDCRMRHPDCEYVNGSTPLVDGDSCSRGKKGGYCVLCVDCGFVVDSSNVFYREKNAGYEYLRIDPYVADLTGSDWTACEGDLNSSPAPGCALCEDQRP